MTSSRGVFPPAPSPWGQFKLAREDENGNENKVDLFILAVKTLLTRRGRGVGLGNRYAGQVDGQLGGLGPARFDVGLILITCEVIQMVGTALRVTGGTEMSTSQKWNL